jgi:hypothetical protein
MLAVLVHRWSRSEAFKSTDLKPVMGQAFCGWIGWNTGHLGDLAGRD